MRTFTGWHRLSCVHTHTHHHAMCCVSVTAATGPTRACSLSTPVLLAVDAESRYASSINTHATHTHTGSAVRRCIALPKWQSCPTSSCHAGPVRRGCTLRRVRVVWTMCPGSYNNLTTAKGDACACGVDGQCVLGYLLPCRFRQHQTMPQECEQGCQARLWVWLLWLALHARHTLATATQRCALCQRAP